MQKAEDSMQKAEAELPADAAVQHLQSMDWIGITEFYHASKCLLFFHIRPMSTETANYFDRTCHCNGDGTLNDTKTEHYSTSKKMSLLDVQTAEYEGGRSGEERLSMIDALTQLDQHVYRLGVGMFFQRIRIMERSLGRRVLCEQHLEQAEGSLSYIFKDLRQLYSTGV